VLILDDDCYADLLFEGAAPPSLYALDPDNVVYIGSFSKVLGPGARLGYFATRKDRLDEILGWKIDGGNSVLAAATAAEYFKNNLWPHIEEINGIVKGKLQAVEDALGANKDAFPWASHPKGGLFIWVKLPEDIDLKRLESIADARNVKYGTGKAFHSQNEDIKYLRIAYGYASLDDIREGVPLLADCVREARGIPVAPSVG
jgi:2-aminoadipate transaminase